MHRFNVRTDVNRIVGDTVDADDVLITEAGTAVFTKSGKILVAYAAHHWTALVYLGELSEINIEFEATAT